MEPKFEFEYEEFMELWNKLSENNKQHIRNGLETTDGMIVSVEQANFVVAIMRSMVAMQELGAI